jgi:endonuclease/exonuclease/phosphatase family metal-dependent hydrolase
MVQSGYTNASPDVLNPLNYTWGINALLTGVDPKRAAAAKKMGNPNGFTDRLDYIFIRNGLTEKSSKIIGIKPPYGSDHAGVVSTLFLP